MNKTILVASFFSAALMLSGRAQEPTLTGNASDLLFSPVGDLFPMVPAYSGDNANQQQPSNELQPAPLPAKSAPELSAEPDVLPATGGDQYKKGTAAQLRMAVRMRQLKTELMGDAAIQGELARARCAKTEEGRRVLMRNYYTLLYTKIEKLDPSLFEVAEKELHDALYGFEQHHVRPSVLIEPGIQPLPGSRSVDHEAGKCTPPPPPATPAPSPLTPFTP